MNEVLIVFSVSVIIGFGGMFLNMSVGITSPPFFYTYGAITHALLMALVFNWR